MGLLGTDFAKVHFFCLYSAVAVIQHFIHFISVKTI